MEINICLIITRDFSRKTLNLHVELVSDGGGGNGLLDPIDRCPSEERYEDFEVWLSLGYGVRNGTCLSTIHQK